MYINAYNAIPIIFNKLHIRKKVVLTAF